MRLNRCLSVSDAHAKLEEGLALLAAGDPACRDVLEDAGTLFEELGDEETVLVIDGALRDAAATIEESPRSFVGFRASATQASRLTRHELPKVAQNTKPSTT